MRIVGAAVSHFLCILCSRFCLTWHAQSTPIVDKGCYLGVLPQCNKHPSLKVLEQKIRKPVELLSMKLIFSRIRVGELIMEPPSIKEFVGDNI